jgi:hypothetical protein
MSRSSSTGSGKTLWTSSPTRQQHQEQNAKVPTQQGILVMVMGQASNYQRWNVLWNSFLTHEQETESAHALVEEEGEEEEYDATLNQRAPTPTSSFFVYASYDAPVNVSLSSCTGNKSTLNGNMGCASSSSTIFIPGTTWTQGRNKLIIEALRLERMFEKEYDYWLFLDDDVEIGREKPEIRMNMKSTPDEKLHWNKFMDVLKDRTLVPEMATTVTMVGGKPGRFRERVAKLYRATSNVDAFVAAFKREYVPYLLPYANVDKGESEWTSQAVLFCVMWCCFKQSAFFIPDINAQNGLHRPYTRGWNISSFQKVIADSYSRYIPLHHRCDKSEHYLERTDIIYASSMEELDALIPSMNSSCNVLKHRFFDWVAQETT